MTLAQKITMIIYFKSQIDNLGCDCATKRRKTKRRITKRQITKCRMLQKVEKQNVKLQNVESYKR
jgi:hypothetical protein